MNMKNILHTILYFALLFCYQACIEDDSTLPTKEISEITIETVSDTINLDYGYELVYDPEVSQTMEDMELSYEWSYNGYVKTSIGGLTRDSLKFLSNEPVLRHTFKKLGEFDLRLKVSNAHGSTFKYFKLFIKSAFDEGIFVLSADENRKGRVSFMRPLSQEEIKAGKEEFFYTDAFASVNPDYPLNDPTDVEKSGADIFILSGSDNLIYRIDGWTFDLYNVIDLNEVAPNTRPLAILSRDRSITDLVIVPEKGAFTYVNYKSDIPYNSGTDFFGGNTRVNKVYYKIPPFTSTSRLYSYHYLINYEESVLYYTYNHLSYYCSSRTFPNEEIINVVMNKDKVTCVVSRSKSNPKEINILRGYASNKGMLASEWMYSYEADNITLQQTSMMQSNDTYNNIFYSSGNKLYRWVNSNNEPVLPTQPILTLDAQCEISCFAFSTDNRSIYLGVYDPSLPDLKGSIYIYDADALDPATHQLKLEKAYKGVADKPIKIFWKNTRK